MLKKIKRSCLQNPLVLAAPMGTLLDERPCTSNILDPQQSSISLIQKIAFLVLVVPLGYGFLTSLYYLHWLGLAMTGFMLMLIVLAAWVSVQRSRMSWKATWHDDRVEVEDGRYGPLEQWSEPLSAFTGLKMELGVIPRVSTQAEDYRPTKMVYGLMLVHPDPFKSLLLHAEKDSISDDIVAWYEQQLDKKLLPGK